MTVAEVLKQSGLTDEQIAAIDAKAMSAFGGVLTTADQAKKEAAEAAVKAEADRKAAEEAAANAKAAQDAADLQKRSVDEFWQNTYNPGVAAWEKERNDLAKKASDAVAEAAFYKAQRESLKEQGIVLADAPTFTPPPAPVIDPNKTPGTPTFSEDAFLKRVDQGVYTIQDIGWKYQQLYGTPIPISPSELISKADAIKLSPMEYAARTFKFAEKEEEHRQAAARKHDQEVAAKAIAEKEAAHKTEIEKLQSEFNAKEKLRAEQNGSNPDAKLPPGSAKFTELKRAVASGERPDPTKMTQQERRQLTLNNIHKAIEERETVVA
jgi:hypothetical protein